MAERKDRSPPRARPGVGGGKRDDGATDEVGTALRSVFEQTIREDIPSEMLDLLNKLA